MIEQSNDPIFTRRQMLQTASCGFGSVALAGLCSEASAARKASLNQKLSHFTPRAKRVIFLYMRGGPAQMDTFEYKPQLLKDDGKSVKSKNRKALGSPFKFQQHGASGQWISELCPSVAKHADDLCIINSMHTDVPNHTAATLQMHTGSFQFVRPSIGAWSLYGLGTENQNLPGFVSISPPIINGGAQNYGSAFLPASFQGTPIGDIKTPVKDAQIGNLKNPRLSSRAQRLQLDFLQSLNRNNQKQKPGDSQLEGVIESYELAFRMQSDLPQLMEFSGETKETLDMYGIGQKQTDDFGRQCLLARRFSEAGVRYIELCHEFWDHHGGLRKGLNDKCGATDQPIGALLTDLKQRGLLDDTLVFWGGEFGRTPDSPKRDGRDHNAKGYTVWLAGGGVQGGLTYGKTDDHGYESVENPVHLHDLNATILNLLGLDHERLTYRYAGRDFRLTDVHGKVVTGIFA